MAQTSREGGCYCGAVRYALRGPTSHHTHCHCAICRRTSGAPFVTWLTIAAADFALLTGTPVTFASTPGAERTFCGACGTPLTFRLASAPEALDVTVCSLDAPEDVRPADHTWTSRQLPWVALADDLPRFARARDDG